MQRGGEHHRTNKFPCRQREGLSYKGNSMCKKHRGVEQHCVWEAEGMSRFGVVDIKKKQEWYGGPFKCPAEEPGPKMRGNLPRLGMHFRDLFLEAVRGTDQSGKETNQNAAIIITLPKNKQMITLPRVEGEPNRARGAGIIFCVCSYEFPPLYLYLLSSVSFETS